MPCNNWNKNIWRCYWYLNYSWFDLTDTYLTYLKLKLRIIYSSNMNFNSVFHKITLAHIVVGLTPKLDTVKISKKPTYKMITFLIVKLIVWLWSYYCFDLCNLNTENIRNFVHWTTNTSNKLNQPFDLYNFTFMDFISWLNVNHQ